MAIRESDKRNRSARNGFRAGEDLEDDYRRGTAGRRVYYEESLEDEEDYEEYARARDRKSGRTQERGTARAGGRTGAERARTGREDSAGSSRKASDRGGRSAQTNPPKKRKKKKGILGIILRLLVIVVLIAAIAAAVLTYKMKDVLEMQRVDSVDLEDQVRSSISSQVNNNTRMDGYKNIALFGVDSRTGDLLDGDNRSDSIMIASINEKTGEIRLVSVYRDTMLNVGDDYYSKANLAYALGGPAQAICMLNRCLDMNIVDFVTVGFEGLANTIDALGGIELEIDEEERGYLNQYLEDMHLELGTDETPVEETGLVTVTGIQATAYSRIRYTAGDDFRRAERQRTVLSKTLEKARQASPAALVDVANKVVGDMATSLSSKEIVSLILMSGSLELTDTGGLPQEDYRAFGENAEDGSYVLPLTLGDNVRWLHSFLFEEENYTLSEEAAAVDAYIQNNYQPIFY